MKFGSGSSRLEKKIVPGNSRACGATQKRATITDYEMFNPTAENSETRVGLPLRTTGEEPHC